jgi:NADH:ubiquinone oxidoreductase subunit 3 (subunit A)
MVELLGTLPVIFLIYLAGAFLLQVIGRRLAGQPRNDAVKASIYASGESPPQSGVAPGYRPYFIIALFFAVLHLGVLILASGGASPLSIVYAAGLLLALLVLLLS